MSAPLVVSIPHHLGREEAVHRLKGGLSRAAAGVPVLATDCCNADELLEGAGGTVVAANSVALAHELSQMLGNRRALSRVGGCLRSAHRQTC